MESLMETILINLVGKIHSLQNDTGSPNIPLPKAT
jgi:hypothetical protein